MALAVVLLPRVTASNAVPLVQPLAAGCNTVLSAYPDNTPPATLAAAVSPIGAVRAIWRLDPATNHMRGWSPIAPSAGDLRVINRFDVVWLCVATAGRLTQPAPSSAHSGMTIHCTAVELPLARPTGGLWDVACSVNGAPDDDTSFFVTALAHDGEQVCEGALTRGSGSCSGRFGVSVGNPALSFHARARPSGATSVDLTPDIR